MRWQTVEGIFTLLHRPGLADRPDHLLIYVTKRPIAEGPFTGMLEDVHHIVYSDGTVSIDSDVLVPPDM
ncbi:hypothetical protein [Hyphomicrobium sp. CS1BSMeth3]|uniref:hypothetical protein n=1 Tax=Hyphomicrobium sp. CS1BSMeth3 TaxID=1892844 RepID=UPI000930656B|nr:hypothetical protein [Hyphomicrobium sp. CS1BSMeth3]